MSHLVEQTDILRLLKKLCTVISYPRPITQSSYELSILVFADASRIDDVGQLGVLTGLLLGPMKKDSLYHMISWVSHKAKTPVKSIQAAGIFAAAKGIDDFKIACSVYNEILDVNVKLRLCVDSKDIFSSLSTQKNSIDKSIRGDVSSRRFEFHTDAVDSIS